MTAPIFKEHSDFFKSAEAYISYKIFEKVGSSTVPEPFSVLWAKPGRGKTGVLPKIQLYTVLLAFWPLVWRVQGAAPPAASEE